MNKIGDLHRTLASLYEGGGFAKGEDGGSVVIKIGHSPSQKSKISDSPLKEGAKASFGKLRFIEECAGDAFSVPWRRIII